MGAAARTRSVERSALRLRRAAAGATDVQDVLQAAAGVVRRQVPHVAAAWLATDPVSGLFNHGHVEAFDADVCTPWFHNELAVADVHKFRELRGGTAAVGHRVADRAARSPRWRELMRPAGYGDELRITCVDGGARWAAVELQGAAGAPDFGPDDVALLEAVAPVVAASIRRVTVLGAARSAPPPGPGIVQVHRDGAVEPLTAAGAAWLERLPRPTGAEVHTALLNVAQLGRALARGSISAAAARVRTRTVDGAWITLHAQPLIDDADGAVAVVLEPTHPGAVADILVRAHGLTARERDVVLALARGASTRQVAELLVLSPHTVRDHVKTVLRKVGVNSRAELLAALFERHYAAALLEGVSHSA